MHDPWKDRELGDHLRHEGGRTDSNPKESDESYGQANVGVLQRQTLPPLYCECLVDNQACLEDRQEACGPLDLAEIRGLRRQAPGGTVPTD